MRGWALAEQGQGEEGIAQMRQGLAALQATGAELTAVLSCPAGRGVWESGADRGRADCAGRGAGYGRENWGASYEAELYRLKGELTLQSRSRV